MGKTMGLGMSSEQHTKVLRGEAVSTNRFYQYPYGVTAKMIYGAYDAQGTLSSNRGTDWRIGKLSHLEQPAVTELMERNGATAIYEEMMSEIHDLSDWSPSWRSRVLQIRKEHAPRFYAAGIEVFACIGEIGVPGKGGHCEY